MKIIHIALGKANPHRANGVNKVLHELISAQKKAKLQVCFWGITPSTLTHDYPKRNFKTILFNGKGTDFRLKPNLQQAINQISPTTIVHLHGGFIPLNFSIAKRLKHRNIPFVFTPHGAYNKKALETSMLRKKIYHLCFDKFIIHHCAKIHLIGESEHSFFSSYKKSLLIPNGQISPEYTIPPKKKTNTLHIGFLGRIDIKTKGLDLLLHALGTLKNSKNIHLHIIGGGGEENRLKKMAQDLNISKNISFHGKKFGEDKVRLLRRLDVYVCASRNEGLPGAPLEAAALGIPLIVSKQSNIHEYVKNFNAGLALDSLNTESLKEAIAHFSEHSTNAFKQGALKMIKHAFNWQTIAKTFAKHYALILKNG